MSSFQISEIAGLVNAKIVCGDSKKDNFVDKAFSSDLMSDVLTLDTENLLLISGLANLQAIRTAEMADIQYILLVRGKRASDEMIQLANDNKMVVLETEYSLFRASGLLFEAGLKPVY